MNSADFASVYRRSIPEAEQEYGPAVEGLASVRFWDNAYGEVLHDRLTSGERVNVDRYDNLSYPDFCVSALTNLPGTIDRAAIPYEQKQRLLGELSFHIHNNAMHPMWFPLLEGNTAFANEQDRLRLISYSQGMIALQGLSYFVQRERLAGKQTLFSYFNTEHEYQRKFTEGLTNELDAGLVLMQVVKSMPDLTVVPGPKQFECDGTRNVPYAADFVVVSSTNKAVGVQVKSFISDHEQADKYDKSRLIMIDGRMDLGNARVMRTQQESTRVKNVSWGGLLCAQFATKMSFSGKDTLGKYISDSTRKKVLQLQMQAKPAIAGMHNDFQLATANIRERIVGALTEVPEPRKPTIIDMAPKPRPVKTA